MFLWDNIRNTYTISIVSEQCYSLLSTTYSKYNQYQPVLTNDLSCGRETGSPFIHLYPFIVGNADAHAQSLIIDIAI